MLSQGFVQLLQEISLNQIYERFPTQAGFIYAEDLNGVIFCWICTFAFRVTEPNFFGRSELSDKDPSEKILSINWPVSSCEMVCT